MSQTKKKVLLIDDEGDLIEIMVLPLAQAGCWVDVALCGSVGIDKAILFQPNLILLDAIMPKMDGWEVCRRLRAHPKTQDIPIIMMTAFPTDALEEQAKEAGATRVFYKPVQVEKLLQLLKEDL